MATDVPPHPKEKCMDMILGLSLVGLLEAGFVAVVLVAIYAVTHPVEIWNWLSGPFRKTPAQE